MQAFSWGMEALMFGSLMMFAAGDWVSSPSSARASPMRCSSVRRSGKFAMTRPGERDVPGLHPDAGRFDEPPDDGQERAGGQGGSLVGVGVDDRGLVGHGSVG